MKARRRSEWAYENMPRSVMGLPGAAEWRFLPDLREKVLVWHVADLLGWQRKKPPRWRLFRYRRWKMDRPGVESAVWAVWQKYGLHGVNCRCSVLPVFGQEGGNYGA